MTTLLTDKQVAAGEARITRWLDYRNCPYKAPEQREEAQAALHYWLADYGHALFASIRTLQEKQDVLIHDIEQHKYALTSAERKLHAAEARVRELKTALQVADNYQEGER